MKKLKKSVSILLTLVMIIGICILPAAADDSIRFVTRSWNASEKTVDAQTAICNAYTDLSHYTSASLASGWYVVKSSFTISNRLYVGNNTVNLILCDGATLTANDGIGVSKNGTLNIYGQTNNSGKIYAHYEKGPESEDINKGIIGADTGDTGTIRIYGGSLDVETGHTINCYYGAAIGGGKGGSPKKIEIFGGDVTCCTKGYGAAIGGGQAGKSSWNTAGGIGTEAGIVIYGGNVTAMGDYGAAIGNGANCGSDNSAIAIFGGSIDASRSSLAAAIGGGEYSTNGPIDIYGGEINVSSVCSIHTGAGIGSGREANQSHPIRIHGGTIVATGGSGAGIGAGYKGNAGEISISNASVVASSTAGGAGIGGGKRDSNTGGHGGNITVSDSTVVATSSEYEEAQAFKDTLNRCIGNSKMKTDATAFADSAVSMIALLVDLFDDNNSGTGIGGGTGGDAGTITLINSDITAESGKYAAAIGSGEEGEVDAINISNCTVHATGGRYAAAIGSGDESDSGCTIHITNGSEVVATAGTDAAGIGTGNDTDGTATITITDSKVTAHGGRYGAGIGGGDDTDGGNITIDNSTVTADSQTDGAGIGGGESGNGGVITITNSSHVTATGGGYAAGIGGGDDGSGGSITISDYSTVTALGGEDGAGIGGGEDGDGGTVKIYNSVVTANGKHYGAGIGCGEDGSSATVEIYGESTVEATSGGSGYATAIGNGDYVASAPSVSTYIDNGLVVHAGYGAFLAQRYTGKQRYNAVWNCTYAKIHPCEHPNTKWRYASSTLHERFCTECNSVTGESEQHIWNDQNVCTICGGSAVMRTLRLVEKNTAGEEVVTEIEVPKYTEYVLPACTHQPANTAFIGWADDDGTYDPGSYYQVTGNTLQAVYATLVQVQYIDAQGEPATVRARRLSADINYLPAGWYVADEDVNFAAIAQNIRVSETVNLIIADGVRITLNDRGGNSLNAANQLTTLCLYGQAAQSGVIGCEYGTMNLAGLRQYGAVIDSEGSVKTVDASIVRGRLKAYLFSATSGFSITGGTVDVSSVTTAVANTIGWTAMTDSIRFDSLKMVGDKASVSVVEGQALTDGENVYTDTLTASQIAALQAKTLTPYRLHRFGEAEWVWSEDYEHASAVFRCTDTGCAVTQRAEAEIQKISEQASTCTASGSVVWEAAVDFEGNTYTNRQTQSLPKLKDMTFHPRVEPTKVKEGNIDYYTCNHCGKYFVYDVDTREYTEIDASQTVLPKLPAANGYSLTLDDSIKVNLLIDTAYYATQSGYIRYEAIADITEQSAERVLSDKVPVTSLPVYRGEDLYNGNCILTLSAAPAQLAEEYVVYIYSAEDELIDTIHASIANYCEAMKTDETYGELMQALLNYGQLANEYFDYAAMAGGAYTVPHSENYKAELTAAERADLNAVAVSKIKTQGNARIQSVSYIAQMKPEFKFYFTNTSSSDVEIQCDNHNLSAVTEQTEDGVVVRVSGLRASEFASTFTLTLDGTTIEYNGYAYIKSVLKQAKMQALAQGIYRYARAAEHSF